MNLVLCAACCANAPNVALPIIATAAHGALMMAGTGAGRGFGVPKQRSNGKRAAKKLRGKLLGCATCNGTGMKPCPICKGTKLMTGFMGATVKCVPCDGKGSLGRKCIDCGGMGFTTPGVP